MRKIVLLGSVLLSLVFAAPAVGADWPQFRGPTGEGLASAEVPLRWGPSRNVAWKQRVPGDGWSSPVVRGRRAVVTSAVRVGDGSGDRALRVLCYDAKDGSRRWDVKVFHQDADRAPRVHRKNSHASPTPVIDGKRIFVHFGHQGTACLSLEGDVHWRRRIRYDPVHGNGGSPAVVGDKVIFSCDSADDASVIALDRKTGKTVWRTPRSVDASRPFSFSTPLAIRVGGQPQVVVPGSGMVGAYAPETGEELWRVEYRGYSVVPRPVYAHGLVYVCTGFDHAKLLAIRPGGKNERPEVVWRVRKGVPLIPSPVVVGDDLFMVSNDGLASCLDAKTGEVHWRKRLERSFAASPLAAAGRVYFQAEDGTCTVVKAAEQYTVLARNDIGETTYASYPVGKGTLWIRTARHLCRIEGGSDGE